MGVQVVLTDSEVGHYQWDRGQLVDVERQCGERDGTPNIPAVERSVTGLLGVLGDVLSQCLIRKARRVEESLSRREQVSRPAAQPEMGEQSDPPGPMSCRQRPSRHGRQKAGRCRQATGAILRPWSASWVHARGQCAAHRRCTASATTRHVACRSGRDQKTGHPLARAPVRHLVGLSVALVAWTRKDLRYATNERAVSAGVSPGGRPPPENGEHVAASRSQALRCADP